MTEPTSLPRPRTRAFALAIAVVGLALVAYVELALTAAEATDQFGWFIYEAVAWLLLLAVGPFLPIGIAVLVAALAALGLEAFAFWQAFVTSAGADAAAVYLWKPLAQVALIAAAWFAGYLTWLHSQRERAHG